MRKNQNMTISFRGFCNVLSTSRYSLLLPYHIWDKVFESGLSEFCGRQPLKNLKRDMFYAQPIF